MNTITEHTASQNAASLNPAIANGSIVKPPEIPMTAVAADEPERFLETVYRNGSSVNSTLTLSEVFALDGSDVDCEINEITGRITIHPQSGPLLRYSGSIPAVGPKVGRPFLEEIMWRPGELVTVSDLLRNPHLQSLMCPTVRASRLKSLRRGFGDTAAAPWFFELERAPWRLRWCAGRSWRTIERLAVPSVITPRSSTA